ncbi:MAG: ABC transporter ATP-binding protein [Bacteroidales bacterium]|nr:ABC transporter ATP-binding protein [Bacteroidales bacterium]
MREVLKTNGLKIGYKGNALMPAIDVTLHEGEHVALIGANGSGKTTLFKTLTGNLKPIEGTIELCGKPLSDYTPNERAKLFSLVLTEKPDDLFLKVFDIVAAGRYPHSGLMAKLRDEDYAMIKAKLEIVGVYHLIDRDFVSLSDGEKQKVMIAKALVQDTPIIYMDEPTAFLDYPSKVELMHLIAKFAKEENKTILYSSHDLELIMKNSEKLWVVAKDKPLLSGESNDLKHDIESYLNIKQQ